jgi:hypothetical protein
MSAELAPRVAATPGLSIFEGDDSGKRLSAAPRSNLEVLCSLERMDRTKAIDSLLTKEEFLAMLGAGKNAKDKAILCLAVVGLRASEISNVKRNWCDMSNRTIKIPPVFAKRRKGRIVPFGFERRRGVFLLESLPPVVLRADKLNWKRAQQPNERASSALICLLRVAGGRYPRLLVSNKNISGDVGSFHLRGRRERYILFEIKELIFFAVIYRSTRHVISTGPAAPTSRMLSGGPMPLNWFRPAESAVFRALQSQITTIWRSCPVCAERRRKRQTRMGNRCQRNNSL